MTPSSDTPQVLLVDGAVYLARWYGVGWWVWELRLGSQERFIDAALSYCTCPQEGVCKHLRAARAQLRAPAPAQGPARPFSKAQRASSRGVR